MADRTQVPAVDSWVIPLGTHQHWLVQLQVFDGGRAEHPRPPRLICYRNGVRALLSVDEVRRG